MPPGTTKPPRRLTNRLPGFGVRVSSFVFRVSGFWFWVSGFGFLVSGFWFLASGFEFRKYQSGRTPKKPAAQGHKLSGSSKVNTPKSCPRIWWGARNLPLGDDGRQRLDDGAVNLVSRFGFGEVQLFELRVSGFGFRVSDFG